MQSDFLAGPFERSGEDTDPFDWTGQRTLAVGKELHAKAFVDSAQLADAAAESSSRQIRRSQLREEVASAYQDFAALAVNDGDLVEAVSRSDFQPLHVFHAVNLDALGPG